MARATMTITRKRRTIYVKGKYDKKGDQLRCPICGKYMAKKG